MNESSHYIVRKRLHCFLMAHQPQLGQRLLIIKASLSHLDTPHSIGLLWMSDRSDAETSTWQHTTLTRERFPCLRRDSNSQSQQRVTADPRFRPRGHWDRQWAPYRFLLLDFKFPGMFRLLAQEWSHGLSNQYVLVTKTFLFRLSVCGWSVRLTRIWCCCHQMESKTGLCILKLLLCRETGLPSSPFSTPPSAFV